MRILREPFAIGNLQITLVGDEIEFAMGEQRTRLDLRRVSLLRYLLEALSNEAAGKYPPRPQTDLGGRRSL